MDKENKQRKADWPDLTFPPINLYVVVPVWFLYFTEEERKKYIEKYIDTGCRDNNIQQR